jgi:CheY-like chemotaxis protein
MDLTPAQALRVAQALERHGLSVDGLTATNPWGHDTPRSREVQAVVLAADPQLAAELMAAGAPPSLAFLALQEQLSGGADVDLLQLPRELRVEVEQRMPAEVQAAAKQREAAALQAMEAGAQALAQRNVAGLQGEAADLDAMHLADSHRRLQADLRQNGRRQGVL